LLVCMAMAVLIQLAVATLAGFALAFMAGLLGSLRHQYTQYKKGEDSHTANIRQAILIGMFVAILVVGVMRLAER